MSESLAGKTALITGGAKRIGRAAALALAAEGVNIVIHYRESSEDAYALCSQIRSSGVRAWPIHAELTDPEQCAALVTDAVSAAGLVDIVFNNASIFPASTLANVTLNDVITNLTINAWAPFVIGRAFAREVGSGVIINALDTRLASYDWGHVAYILSKHVLAVLTRMTALEYAPKVRVNAIAPGLILPPPGRDDSYLDALIDTVPLKRHGSVEDIAEAVVFLCKSSFITGDTLYIDGGRHLTEASNGPGTQ
jgi:pteridine reductase